MHEGIPRVPDQLQMCKSPLHVLCTISSGKQLAALCFHQWQLNSWFKSKVLFLQCYCFGEAPQQPCMLFWDTHYHTFVTGKVQGILEKRNCNYLRDCSLHIHRLTKYTLLIRVCTPWFYFVFCRMGGSVILRSVEWWWPHI